MSPFNCAQAGPKEKPARKRTLSAEAEAMKEAGINPKTGLPYVRGGAYNSAKSGSAAASIARTAAAAAKSAQAATTEEVSALKKQVKSLEEAHATCGDDLAESNYTTQQLQIKLDTRDTELAALKASESALIATQAAGQEQIASQEVEIQQLKITDVFKALEFLPRHRGYCRASCRDTNLAQAFWLVPCSLQESA